MGKETVLKSFQELENLDIIKKRVNKKDYEKIGSDDPAKPYEDNKVKPLNKTERKKAVKKMFSEITPERQEFIKQRQEKIEDTKKQIENLENTQKKGKIKVKSEKEKIQEDEKLINAITSSVLKKLKENNKEEKAIFSFQIGKDGPKKELKKSEEFELKEIVNKKGEPEKIETIKYKIEGLETDRNGMKLLLCLNLNKTNKEGKVLPQDYTRFSIRDLKDSIKNNWIKFKDDKFAKEFEEWNKKTKNTKEPLKLIKKDQKQNINKKESKKEKIEKIGKILKEINELKKGMPKKDLEENKAFYNNFLKITNDEEIKEFINKNLKKVEKAEELQKQLENLKKP